MFAVVRTGGKQYRVSEGDRIAVEKLAGEAGETVTLGDVLLAGDGETLTDAGGMTVSAEIIAQAKSEKVVVFKKKRRHNYRRKRGHRQQLTLLRITAVGDGEPAAKKPAASEPVGETALEKTEAPARKATKAEPATGATKPAVEENGTKKPAKKPAPKKGPVEAGEADKLDQTSAK